MRTHRAVMLVAVAGLGVSGLSGCLVSGHSDSRVSGAYVGPSTFGQVEPGVTREEWVVATFGKPTEKSKLADGSEIWKWTSVRTKSGRGSVLFLYSGRDRSEVANATFVQLLDGVVIKAWRD